MIKLGLAQMDISWENPAENIKKCGKFFELAKSENVDALVFPETTGSGFTNNVGPAIESFQSFFDEIRELTTRHNITVVFGAIAPGQEKAQNQNIAFNPDGDVLWRYTKIHPFSFSEEDLYFEKGSEIVFGEICGARCSPFTCYDLRFPEVFQAASHKAEVLVIIANWPAVRVEHWDVFLKARAIENQSFVVGVNRVGSGNGIQYCGHSAVISPEGVVLNDIAEDERLIIVEIEPEESIDYRNSFRVKQDRNLELYSQFYGKRELE